MDYDGRNQRKLTSVGLIAITPNFSRADDRIAYTAWRGNPPRATIEIVSETGGRQRFEQAGGVSNQTPSWSPDGKFVVYTSNRDGDNEIYWANADGKESKRLTNSRGIDQSPAINPATGRQIAFISARGGTTPALYTMDSDGTNVQRLTEEGDAQNPAYSPDGSMIAFAWSKRSEGGFEIYLYDFRMRKFTQLTSSSGRNERPTWAPDGKHIAFYSNRSGKDQVYAMTLDGRKVWQLTNTGANEAPSWSGYPAR
jgi:TolB protein